MKPYSFANIFAFNKKAFTLCTIICVTLASHSQDYSNYGMEGNEHPNGLAAGAEALDFSGIDQHGDKHTLSKELEKGAVVIVFYRGAWCPYCIRYLGDLTDSLGQIQNAGATVIAVTPQGANGINKASEKLDNGITLLSDTGGEIMSAYDTKFDVTDKYSNKIKFAKGMSLAESNGQKSAQLPVPATYVIDKNGIIIDRHFDYDYKNRYTVSAILNALKK